MAHIPIPNLALSLNAEYANDPVKIGWQGFQAASNIRSNRGTVKKRPGLSTLFSGITGIPLLLQNFTDSNTVLWNLIVTTTKVYARNATTTVLNDITPSGFTAGLTPPCQGAVFVGGAPLRAMWFLTTGSAFYFWDGVLLSAQVMSLGSPLSALAMIAYGNHLLLGNVVTASGVQDQLQIAWSDFNLGTNFTSGDATAIDLRDDPLAYNITGLGTYLTTGVALKTDATYIITTLPAPFFYEFDRRSDTVGCIATGSIQELPIGCGFLWRDDYYVFTGSQPVPVGGNYRKNFFARANAQFLNATFSWHDDVTNTLYLAIPDATWTSTVPVYNVHVWDWKYNTWTPDQFAVPGGVSAAGSHMYQYVSRTFAQSVYGFNVSPYRFNDVTQQSFSSILVAGATSGKVYQFPPQSVFADDGAAYDSQFQTGLVDGSDGRTYAGYPIRKQLTKWRVVTTPESAGALAVTEVSSTDGITLSLWPKQTLQLNAADPSGWEIPVQKSDVYHGVLVDDQSGTQFWEVRTMVAEIRMAGGR